MIRSQQEVDNATLVVKIDTNAGWQEFKSCLEKRMSLRQAEEGILFSEIVREKPSKVLQALLYRFMWISRNFTCNGKVVASSKVENLVDSGKVVKIKVVIPAAEDAGIWGESKPQELLFNLELIKSSRRI